MKSVQENVRTPLTTFRIPVSLAGFTDTSLVQLMQRAIGGTQTTEYRHEGLTVNARAVYPIDSSSGNRIREFPDPLPGRGCTA
jgi:hypothetical protein